MACGGWDSQNLLNQDGTKQLKKKKKKTTRSRENVCNVNYAPSIDEQSF